MSSEARAARVLARTAIVTRTKNRAFLLRRAIESVLSQTDPDWIHVVVNDGGDARPIRALIEEYEKRYAGRILLVDCEHSNGMEAASNLGIGACNSEFLLIHDDDDSLQPDFLAKTTAYLLDPPARSVQGVASRAMLLEEHIEEDRVFPGRKRLFRNLGPIILAAEAAVSNPIPPISFLFRRSAYEEIGGFDEDLPVLGDWEFLIRFLGRFDVGVIQEPLANYHIRPRASGRGANSVISDAARHQFFENIVRNKAMRDGNPTLALLLQRGQSEESSRRKLEILFSHPVIGRLIRSWSKLINPRIPSAP